MADEDEFGFEDELDGDEGQQQQQPPKNANALRKQREQIKNLEKQLADREVNESAEKTLAFYKAGLDPEKDAAAKVFAATYAGDMTSEAIEKEFTAFKESLGLPAPGTEAGAEQGDEQQTQEPSGSRERQALSGEGTAAGAQGGNFVESATTEALESVKSRKVSRTEAGARLINTLANGAMQGLVPTLEGDGQNHLKRR